MNEQSVFRIESRRFANYMQFFKIGAIISTIVVTMYLILKLAVFDGQVEYINLAGYAFAFSMYYEYKRKAKAWGGQFIEATGSVLSFKTRKNEQTTIRLDTITNIGIKLDQIILQTTELGEHTIVLEDFTEYKDRMMIKNKFAELKKQLNTS